MKPFLLINHIFVILLVTPFSCANPPKAVFIPNPERLQLLEDALSWLTLRSDGKLLEPNKNKWYIGYLHEQYNSSLYFRTIVIAFQLGVLPKLTLQQGQPCDPAYTLRYRSELNNSVTWYKVKNFTLENYYNLRNPGSPSGPYCDYRKGLVCLPTTKKCDCPEGSKMGPIEANSQVQRCLIEEDEICVMPDVSAYKNIGVLIVKLPELIFNLEKPQSCKHGTTCRVKDSPYPRCLSTAKAPFEDNNKPPAKYGEECLLDYLGEGGGCDVNAFSHENTACFDFSAYIQKKRLTASGVHKRTGFCALDVAPYMTPGVYSLGQTTGAPTVDIAYPFVNAFVNPGTVKMSSDELLDYDHQLHITTAEYNWDKKPSSIWDHGRKRRIQREVGEPCSVTATAKIIDIWNFFASLDKVPPQGQDFVADVPTLQAKLVEYSNLTGNHKDYEPRICRIYWEMTSSGDETPPLTCISTGAAPDAKGNDGTCQISNNKDTYGLTLNMYNFRHDDYRSKDEILNKDKYHNPQILKDNPEVRCIPSQSTRRSRSRYGDDYDDFEEDDRHIHGDVLEGGNCTEGFACVEDLSESHGIYKNPKDKKDCSFKEGYQPHYNCLNIASEDDDVKWESCEEELLNQRVMDAIQRAPRLGMGAPCSYKLTKEIIEALRDPRFDTNRYGILSGLETTGICDQTKLLRCNEGNICACRWYSAPRTTADKKYISDYCYMTSGPCSRNLANEDDFIIPLTVAEKKEMVSHYGKSSVIKCRKGNVCKFIDACTRECTDVNTGSTGVDVDVMEGCVPITTTTTTTSTEKSPIRTDKPTSRPLEPPRPFNGAEMSLKKQSYLSVVIINIIMIFVVNSFTFL